jgi:hypothetical protein
MGAGEPLCPTHIQTAQSPDFGRRSTAEIAAWRQLTPHAQGDLIGLCALYSTTNAIQLVLASVQPLSRAASQALFVEGLRYLDRKNGLLAAAVDGIGPRRRLSLAKHLARHASTGSYSIQIERADHKRLRSIAQIMRWIEISLRDDKPVLMGLEGGLEHWTVVAAVTPKTLVLFDSVQQFIRKSSCHLAGGYIQIAANCLLRVAVNRSG